MKTGKRKCVSIWSKHVSFGLWFCPPHPLEHNRRLALFLCCGLRRCSFMCPELGEYKTSSSSSCVHLGPKPSPSNTFAGQLFWFLLLVSLPVYSWCVQGIYPVSAEHPERRAISPMYWQPGGPSCLPHGVSSPTLLPVGSHSIGSRPCGNLWQVGSKTHLQQQRTGGEVSFQVWLAVPPGTPLFERRACGWPIEISWQKLPCVPGILLITYGYIASMNVLGRTLQGPHRDSVSAWALGTEVDLNLGCTSLKCLSGWPASCKYLNRV